MNTTKAYEVSAKPRDLPTVVVGTYDDIDTAVRVYCDSFPEPLRPNHDSTVILLEAFVTLAHEGVAGTVTKVRAVRKFRDAFANDPDRTTRRETFA